MTGIIVAMESEAKPILEIMKVQKQTNIAGKPCYKGTIAGHQACLIISDIGKVNAACAAQGIICTFPEIDKIINIGVAGAVAPDLEVCDICVAEKSIQYDFDVTAIDDVPIGYIQSIKQQYLYSDKKMYGKLMSKFNKSVTVATADRFSHSQQDKDFIIGLGCDIRDMELGAIYQVCAINGLPAISIKSISDTAKGNPAEEFAENLHKSTYCYQPHLSDILDIINS